MVSKKKREKGSKKKDFCKSIKKLNNKYKSLSKHNFWATKVKYVLFFLNIEFSNCALKKTSLLFWEINLNSLYLLSRTTIFVSLKNLLWTSSVSNPSIELVPYFTVFVTIYFCMEHKLNRKKLWQFCFHPTRILTVLINEPTPVSLWMH